MNVCNCFTSFKSPTNSLSGAPYRYHCHYLFKSQSDASTLQEAATQGGVFTSLAHLSHISVWPEFIRTFQPRGSLIIFFYARGLFWSFQIQLTPGMKDYCFHAEKVYIRDKEGKTFLKKQPPPLKLYFLEQRKHNQDLLFWLAKNLSKRKLAVFVSI